MSGFSEDLLRAASRLIRRRAAQKGPLKSAYVRRSISTTYYAIFHFMLAEVASRLVGTSNEQRHRRRLFVRTMSHASLATTFGKLRGATVDRSIDGFFRLPSTPAGPVVTPVFLRQLAATFLDAKSKREDADYDLNEPVSEIDAHQILRRVIRAIADWEKATTPQDRDTKHAVALLVSAGGKLKER